MKIVSINTFNIGSTGKIMRGISEAAREYGHTAYICVPRSRDNSFNHYEGTIWIGNRITRNLHRILSKFINYDGAFSYFSTKLFIRRLKKINPDIIHLHNLHGWYINISLLFKYIKRNDIKVIWTLHDCWAFTGHCPYFDMIKCNKWKKGCFKCQQKNIYPQSKIDTSRRAYNEKSKIFNGVVDLTIVTPSKWLGNMVNESFLNKYKSIVINNGIDLSIFTPLESNFRTEYQCEGKFIILGVAFDWSERKGIDVFIELAKRLSNKFQIILVGTNNDIDSQLPINIISIQNTQNQSRLAQIYSSADLFVNPTREDNFPTVNIESLACGTPVITFNTGGSPEIINKLCGAVVEKNDIDKLEKKILEVYQNNPFLSNACVNRARCFDKNNKFKEYVELYEDKFLND